MLVFYYCFESVYNPYPRNRIPMINATIDALDTNSPTYSNHASNKEASHEVILLMNIAIDMYFAEIRIANIRQKLI